MFVHDSKDLLAKRVFSPLFFHLPTSRQAESWKGSREKKATQVAIQSKEVCRRQDQIERVGRSDGKRGIRQTGKSRRQAFGDSQ